MILHMLYIFMNVTGVLCRRRIWGSISGRALGLQIVALVRQSLYEDQLVRQIFGTSNLSDSWGGRVANGI